MQCNILHSYGSWNDDSDPRRGIRDHLGAKHNRFRVVLGVLYVLGFGWEQYIATGLERWWIIASTILLSSISVHHYIVDSFIWRRTVGR